MELYLHIHRAFIAVCIIKHRNKFIAASTVEKEAATVFGFAFIVG
jgi:hypothetical protein